MNPLLSPWVRGMARETIPSAAGPLPTQLRWLGATSPTWLPLVAVQGHDYHPLFPWLRRS